ncbi:MAG TPA: hypothetical protein VJN43_09085 [Bryobacteraceae bacterium]|nr:hypothetical protein [Bryobacteraceae bacterium]
MLRRTGFAFVALVLGGCWQIKGQVYPVPIPGGDVFPSVGGPVTFVNQFFPGVGSFFDGLNAEPHGIINSNGTVAMGYTSGTATDSSGKVYNIATDIRVYQGKYVGAIPHDGAGGTVSAKAFGTFVEI